jgi:hypothetical protein
VFWLNSGICIMNYRDLTNIAITLCRASVRTGVVRWSAVPVDSAVRHWGEPAPRRVAEPGRRAAAALRRGAQYSTLEQARLHGLDLWKK